MGELIHAQPPGFSRAAREAWEHAGIRCAIIASPMGGWNGYVQLPWGHPWRARKRGEVPLPGISHGPDPDGWVGFDTGHAGDAWHPDDDVAPHMPSWWPKVAVGPAVRAHWEQEIGAHLAQTRRRLAASLGEPLWTIPRLRARVEQWARLVALLEGWEHGLEDWERAVLPGDP